MGKLYKGSHGTCNSFAETISAKGFYPSAGIRGKASYFWDEINGSEICLKLSKSWHKQCLDRNKYSGQKDQGCAIFTAEVQCEDLEVLDFTDRNLKMKITEIVERHTKGSKTPSVISEGYDKAIQAVEIENKLKIKVLLAQVTGPDPKYCKYYSFEARGSPGCIIARFNDIISNVYRLTKDEVVKVEI
jgi:hypothetical protein